MQKTWVILSALLLTILLIILSQTKQNADEEKSPYADFVVHIPQKALLKNYLNISAEAAPGTICTLTYIPPSGESLQMDVTANSSGLCEWRWKIEESHRAGDARLIFTINGQSDTHFIQIFAEF